MRRKQLIWISLGILTLFIGYMLRHHPAFTESVYGNGVFIGIRWIMSNTFNRLPFPGITLLCILGIWFFWRTALMPLRKKTWTGWTLIGGILSTVGGAVFLFQLLWGFNYFRPTWDKRLGIEVQGMTAEQLAAEFHRSTTQLNAAVKEVGNVDVLAFRTQQEHAVSVESELRGVLRDYGFPLSYSPRVRIVKPKGILMRWNTAGIYVPFSGESHVDAGMLPIQIPFTLTHEMAHGFGVADEGDCNFLAYLACNASEEPIVRFAGIFSYWRYVASEYRFTFQEEYNMEFQQLPELVKRLLAEIRANDAKYPDLFPRFRNTVYDTYLKSQGVHDGLQSYDRVVQLVWEYENR